MKQKRQPLNRAEKRVLWATVLSGASLLAAPIWWHFQDADIAISIPEPTLPLPNAYDDYVRAVTQVVYKSEVSRASSHHAFLPLHALPISPPQDVRLEPPTVVFSPPKMPSTVRRVLDREYSIVEKEWLVKQNAPVFQSLAQGLKRSCAQPPQSDVLGIAPAPKFHSLFDLMTLKAQVQAQRGDINGALQTLLAEMQLSSGLSQKAPQQATFVAARGEQQVVSELWKLMPRLNAAQTKQATRRLETLNANRPTYAQMLQEEKWCTQRGLLKAFQLPDWRLQLAWSLGSTTPKWSYRAQAFALNAISKRRVFNTYTRYYGWHYRPRRSAISQCRSRNSNFRSY